MAETDSDTDKPTTISKHKTGPSRRMAASDKSSGPQAFDIVPRSQVRPEATSRPVIASSQPPVADNTLLKPAGVSVGDLIAKRSKYAIEQPANGSPANEDEPGEGDARKSAGYFLDTEVSSEAADEKPAPATPASETVKPTETVEATEVTETTETGPLKPPAEGTIEQALYEDPSKPQAHSESLKNAINELEQSDDNQHHELYGGKPVIIVHGAGGSKIGQLLLALLCLFLLALAADLMLDAGIVSNNYNIPHTDILQ